MEKLNYSHLANTTSSSYKTHTGIVATLTQRQVSLTPNATTVNVVLVTCFLCIVIIIAVLGNSFALIAFKISRELRRVTYYFIINLCISDIFVALLSMPFWISYLLTGWPSNKSGVIYSIWINLDIFCGTWSITSLAVISIERYIFVIYPLRYVHLVTKKRAWLAVAFVLAYSTFTSCLVYVRTLINKYTVSIGIFVLAYVIPVFIQMFTYRKIYSEARRQHRFMMQEASDRQRLRELYETVTTTVTLDTVQTSFGSQSHRTISCVTSCDTVSKEDEVEIQNIDKVVSTSFEGGNDLPTKQRKHACKRQRFTRSSLSSRSFSSSSVNQNTAWNSAEYVSSYVQGNDATCCFLKDEKCNRFRVYWRKWTSEDRQSINSDREEPCESECDSKEKLRRDGIEDWVAYLDGLPTKVEIENMDSRSDDVKYPLEIKESSNQMRLIEESNERFEAKSSSNSLQANQENEQTITNSQYPLISTAESTQGSKANGRFHSSKLFSPTSVKLFRSEGLAEMRLKSIARLRRLNREMKTAKLIGAIIGTFLVLWTPFMLVVILASVDVPISMDTVIIAKCLHYANSAINPILYVVLNIAFRRAASSMMNKLSVSRSQST